MQIVIKGALFHLVYRKYFFDLKWAEKMSLVHNSTLFCVILDTYVDPI